MNRRRAKAFIDPRSLDKFIYEVVDGVDLFFDEETNKPDGWYFAHDPYVMHGPYEDVEMALCAAEDVSNFDAKIEIIDMRGELLEIPNSRTHVWISRKP
jgi:hypothetical protein